jgi:hypothetical protein
LEIEDYRGAIDAGTGLEKATDESCCCEGKPTTLDPESPPENDNGMPIIPEARRRRTTRHSICERSRKARAKL